MTQYEARLLNEGCRKMDLQRTEVLFLASHERHVPRKSPVVTGAAALFCPCHRKLPLSIMLNQTVHLTSPNGLPDLRAGTGESRASRLDCWARLRNLDSSMPDAQGERRWGRSRSAAWTAQWVWEDICARHHCRATVGVLVGMMIAGNGGGGRLWMEKSVGMMRLYCVLNVFSKSYCRRLRYPRRL